MIETLSIRDMEKKATNMYEAIIVLAKRARQINNDQKQARAAEHDYEEDYGNYVDEDFPVEMPIDYEELPKPTAIALEEFMNNKIKFDYIEDKDREAAAPSSS